MKKILLSLAVTGLALAAMAQVPGSYKKRPSLGLNFVLKDMTTADLIDHSSLSSVLSNNQWTKIGDMFPGMGLSFASGVSEKVDFLANLTASFVKYPFAYKTGVTSPSDSKFLLESDANIVLKLVSDKYTVVPYLSAGIGASMYAGTYFAAYAPVGLGLQINLGEGTFVNTRFVYNTKVSPLSTNHFNYTIGVLSALKDKPVLVAPPPPPPPPVVEKDADNDGIVDSRDKCPTVPGTAKYDGCPVPDTDGDGINDENDKCPTVKGLPKYDGCPVPDRDKDGVNDDEDKCPDVAGVARYQGCPVPDRDKDGVNDEEDKCPDVPGVKENAGCPEIQTQLNRASANVYFATNGTKVLAKSYPELNRAVDLMKQYPHVQVTIEGHTDATGNDKINDPLSQKRAESVKDYLVSQGIDAGRLTATGYGSKRPIADNKTAKGRALNRRVVMTGDGTANLKK
jgi:OOP family OmpA-OmpF porin